MKRKNKKVVAESLPVSAEETIKNARAEMKDEDFLNSEFKSPKQRPFRKGNPRRLLPLRKTRKKSRPRLQIPSNMR